MRLLFIMLLLIAPTDSFREEQHLHARVRQAYLEKESIMKVMLAKHSVGPGEMELYLRAFKEEKKMEVRFLTPLCGIGGYGYLGIYHYL